jgi:dipeptidyl aminopeptidase/acylaminoacyl peptidase
MLSTPYVCAKSRRQKFIPLHWLAVGTLSLFVASQPTQAQVAAHDSRRRVTEEDAIRMTRIAGHEAINSYAGMLTEDFAYFSPNRKQFVIVLKKGNLEENTNDYSLLLYKTSEVFDSPKPRILATMRSSSNRAALTDLVWLSDNDTMLFLGENPGESSQLYSMSSRSGTLKKLTNQPANLTTFSSDARGRTIVYAAEKPSSDLTAGRAAHDGVVVSGEDLSDLLVGRWRDKNRDLFVLDTATGEARQLRFGSELGGELHGDYLHFSLSPDGSRLVVNVNLLKVSPKWRAYRDQTLATILDRDLSEGALSWVARYGIIDTESGESRVLLDAPISYFGSEVVWPDDGRSVVLTGVFVPVDDARDDAKALASPAVLEVDTKTLQYKKVSDDDLRFKNFDRASGLLAFETRPRRTSYQEPEPRFFRMESGHWSAASVPPKKSLPLVVVSEQDLNNAPKVGVFDPDSGRKAVLLDPNPQFQELKFGTVKEIRFTGAEHTEVRAGLYFPSEYIPGNKYPLVVQTHGFDPKGFWIDGSFTTAFAAQALVSHGFLVLQVPDVHKWDETPAEAPNMAETLERAVEYVDGLGLLDRERIGLIGFSRTGLYVHYLLTHSHMPFRAAVIADGSDGGYTQYLQFLNAYPFTASDSEMINGGAPFGSGLLLWLRSSPEFFLDQVKTPLLLQVTSTHNLPSMWAPYIGLKRLGKPVELMYLPTGSHIIEKPWDRLASQQGSVDWMTFWLKGEEDADPLKAEKYKRWRELRKRQTDSAHVPKRM